MCICITDGSKCKRNFFRRNFLLNKFHVNMLGYEEIKIEI